MSTFYAQPYDTSADGFYFESGEDFEECSAKAVNAYGQRVEEFEIQFIDGLDIDAALFDALKPHQGNISQFIRQADEWEDDEKRRLIVAGECGYAFDLKCGDPDDFDIDIYEIDSLQELAEQFVDEGLFGDIPDHLTNYIDYDAIARDLACDYAETNIAGRAFIYRCG